MSERKINLEEILWKSFYNNGIPKPTHSLAEITQKAVKEAMKEACRQILELVAENAEVTINSIEDLKLIVDKQSILDTINQIE